MLLTVTYAVVEFLIRTSETKEEERRTCEDGVTSSFYSEDCMCVKSHLRPTRRQLLGRKGQMKEEKVTDISHRHEKISPNHVKPTCGMSLYVTG